VVFDLLVDFPTPRPRRGASGGDPFLLFHSEGLDQSQGAQIGPLPPKVVSTCREPAQLADIALGTSGTCFVLRGLGTDLVDQSSLCSTCLMLLLALGTHPVVQKKRASLQVDVGSMESQLRNGGHLRKNSSRYR
jgi:hypothetical protein